MLVSPEDMPFQEVMGQRQFHSRQITHLGQPIAWEHWARQSRTTVEHLQDLLRSGAAQPAQQQEMALLLDAMPAAWAAHIHGPSPQPTHLASADPADRRIFCPGLDGHLTHTYTASSTAALLAVEQLPQPMLGQDLPADLRPVLVIQWDPTRPWHPRLSAGQTSPQPMQIKQQQVPAVARDELMEWIDSHTALSVQQSRAAIAQLHSQMPHLLMAQPIPQPVYAALSNFDNAETQSDSSAPGPGQCGSDATAQLSPLALSCRQPTQRLRGPRQACAGPAERPGIRQHTGWHSPRVAWRPASGPAANDTPASALPAPPQPQRQRPALSQQAAQPLHDTSA